MKFKLIIIYGLGFFWGLSYVMAPQAQAEEIPVDNIAKSQTGYFPKDWKTYPFHKNKASRVYKVAENSGHKFIRAVDHDDISVAIFKDFYWDLEKYPYLKFKWRAQKLPKGAKEVRRETNDSACGVYVGWGRTHALKYVWSTSLNPGSYWAKNPDKFFIISLKVGEKDAGKWEEVTLHVPPDYERYFKRKPKGNPEGIGLLTDGNAVHQPAECDYADFRISSTP